VVGVVGVVDVVNVVNVVVTSCEVIVQGLLRSVRSYAAVFAVATPGSQTLIPLMVM